MQEEILIIILLIILAVLFISIVFNFKAMLDFKWKIDYMISKDAVCQDYRWTKFEIEGMRYNLSNFFYNDNSFQRIVKDYKITYSFITFFISLVMLFYIFIKIAVNYKTLHNHFKNIFQYLKSKCSPQNITTIPDERGERDKMNEIKKFAQMFDIPIIFFGMMLSIYIIHMTFTSRYLQMLDVITAERSNNDTANTLAKYYICYKILSAIIVMTNIKNTKVEMSHPGLNDLSYTFDKLLERNIASYENTNNTSKVKNIKLNAYAKLDFLKYFVFDQLSPYYLKYFDNVYVSIPSDSTKQLDVSHNFYLDDLYAKHIRIVKNNTVMNEEFNALRDIPKLKSFIPEKILPGDEFAIYMKIKSEHEYILKDTSITDYDSNGDVQKKLTRLASILQYPEINDKIGGIIKHSGANIQVDDNDYIKYFIENRDILFDDTKLSDFQNTLNENANVIFAYVFYFTVYFIMISHYLYMTLEGSTYIYTILGIIALYILFVWFYTNASLMMTTA